MCSVFFNLAYFIVREIVEVKDIAIRKCYFDCSRHSWALFVCSTLHVED